MNNNFDRFQKPIEGVDYGSEYDLSSEDILSPVLRNIPVVSTYTFDLTVANTQTIINEPGTGFVIQGFDPSSPIEAKKLDAFINVAINSDGNDGTKIYPGKTGRGYNGSFQKLTLSWPAQAANTSARFIILKSKNQPWKGGLEAT